VVVGRLDAWGLGEGPERGPASEQVLGELPVVFGSRARPGRVSVAVYPAGQARIAISMTRSSSSRVAPVVALTAMPYAIVLT
jgi:hypothetical protein